MFITIRIYLCNMVLKNISIANLLKKMAERLWKLFKEQLKGIITVIAEAGVIDSPEFRKSEEFQYLKELFED